MGWTLKRLAISVFILVHVSAVAQWNMPKTALRDLLGFHGWTEFYMLPTGLWQSWDMFGPDPQRASSYPEAVVRDAQGMIHIYKFQRLGDLSVWDAFWLYRHAKVNANLTDDKSVVAREVAARHALRSLGLPREAYPAEVDLTLNLWPTPALGDPPLDPMTPPQTYVMQVYRFPTWEEANEPSWDDATDEEADAL